jgi:hypothetical protein
MEKRPTPERPTPDMIEKLLAVLKGSITKECRRALNEPLDIVCQSLKDQCQERGFDIADIWPWIEEALMESFAELLKDIRPESPIVPVPGEPERPPRK